MPSLLSPRKSDAKTVSEAMEEPEEAKSSSSSTKKKSMMGRLTSKLSSKLGKKKGGDSTSAPTTNDLKNNAREPETSSATQFKRSDDKEQDEQEQETNGRAPDTEVMRFEASTILEGDEEDEEDEQEEEQEEEQEQERQETNRLAKWTQPKDQADAKQLDDSEESEEEEEAPAKAQAQAPAAIDDDDEEELEVFEEEQQQLSNNDPGESKDLTIVGVSHSQSQAKESSEPAAQPSTDPVVEQEACVPFPSPRKTIRGSHVPPLLSDFKFNEEPLSPTLNSPLKRRALPNAHRPSFARDINNEPELKQEQKESTPVDIAAVGSPLPSPRKTIRPVHPPRRSRGSSLTSDAPILASSFMNGLATEEPAEDVKEEDGNGSKQQQQDDEKQTGEKEEADDDEKGGFDAGAAITREFGERVARLLGADPWGDRQDGFDSIQYLIKKTDLEHASNRKELLAAAFAAIQCGVDDRVAPVMFCALDCFRTVLKEFSPILDRSFTKCKPLKTQTSALCKTLIGKLGDSNKRTQREAAQALVRLVKSKRLHALELVLAHFDSDDVPPRLRVDLLQQLLKELGSSNAKKQGLTVEAIMKHALPALKIADEKTRKAAVELLATLHVHGEGQAVNGQLLGVKTEMLRVINRRVEELLAQKQKEESEKQVNTNQSDETDDPQSEGAALLPVPNEEAKLMQVFMETQLNAMIAIVGPVAWRKLESKTWSDRKEALVDLEKTINEAKSDLREVRPAQGSVVQQNFLAYCTIVHRFLSDSIAPVVNSAMDCFVTLIKVFGVCVEWREDAVRDMTLLTIMRLFGTMQKPNNRTNRAACRCLLKLARLSNPHPFRYVLSCIFNGKDADAAVQMHLLRLLIPEFGFQNDGISAAHVMTLVASVLNRATEKTKKIAIDVAVCTQRLMGKDYVMKYLKDVKASTLKEVEKHFVETEKPAGDRPQTVQLGAREALPPVNFGSNSESSRRMLSSAPVGVGKLQFAPSQETERPSAAAAASTASAPVVRRASVLSNDEESLMASILDGSDEFI